eukprot:326353_1
MFMLVQHMMLQFSHTVSRNIPNGRVQAQHGTNMRNFGGASNDPRVAQASVRKDYHYNTGSCPTFSSFSTAAFPPIRPRPGRTSTPLQWRTIRALPARKKRPREGGASRSAV